ncbi:hypothetical protein [Aquabacter cavernae]|uniref:hypothetical protein n=1 Tax=Aquabacter cavernae TaxID=2496029 RepID=UPI000F8F808A|nr:hypothetical protein [Aquabacter cavernae]
MSSGIVLFLLIGHRKGAETSPDVSGNDPPAVFSSGGSEDAGETVDACGAVNDDRAAIPSSETQTLIGEGGGEGRAVIGTAPGNKSSSAYLGDRGAGAVSLPPFSGSLSGHRAAAAEKSRGLHRIGDVATPILHKGLMDGAVVLAAHEGEAAFMLDETAHLLAAGVFM